MAKLTEAQKTFLRDHGFWNGELRGGRSTLGFFEENTFKKFHERRERIMTELARLPESKRGPYEELLQNAEELAKKKDFKGAYKSLHKVKRRAQAEANNSVGELEREELQDLRERLEELEFACGSALRFYEEWSVGKEKLKEDLAKEPKAADFKTLPERYAFALRFSEAELLFHIELDWLIKRAEPVVTWRDEYAESELNDIESKLNRLRDVSHLDVEAEEHLLEVCRNRYSAIPKLDDIEKDVQGFRPQFEELLNQHRNTGSGDREEKLKKLEERNKERLKRVREKYERDSQSDDRQVQQTEDKITRGKSPKRFDFKNMALDLKLPDINNLKEEDIEQASNSLAQCIENVFQLESGKPKSDLLFDLSLMSRSGLKGKARELFGVPKNDRTKDQERLLEAASQKMWDVIERESPNKAGEVVKVETEVPGIYAPATISLGDDVYEKPAFIAKGGQGEILRYEKAGMLPKQYVIIKSNMNPGNRSKFVQETRMHYQINGGEGQKEPDPNVVQMKGVIRGKNMNGDECVFTALEYAEGGDLSDVSGGLEQLSSFDVISNETRQLVAQHLLRQSMVGMMRIQELGMTHHDVKPGNYLIGDDGTVKIADFGSIQKMDAQGTVPNIRQGFTQGYYPPEEGFDEHGKPQLGRLTGKVDTYALGVMLNDLNSPYLGTEKGDKSLDVTTRGSLKSTALDKLKNAMLDPDPKKRPTLESVLQASYLNDSLKNYDQEKLANLMKAVTAYNKYVGSKVKKDMATLVKDRKELFLAEKEKAGAKEPSDIERLTQQINQLKQSIRETERKIEQVLRSNEAAPFVASLKDAERELTGRNSIEDKIDYETLDYAKLYTEFCELSKTEPDGDLLKSLTAVNNEQDIAERLLLSEFAEEETSRVIEEVAEIKPDSEEAKLAKSSLLANLRKLRGTLAGLRDKLNDEVNNLALTN